MTVDTKYVKVKNKRKTIELEFVIVKENNIARILVSFLDNENFLYWLSTVWAENEKDLEQVIMDKIDMYIKGDEEDLYGLLETVENFYRYDLSDYDNLLNLINRGFVF